MIGTISIEVNAKNPNLPLHPLRAYVNSPSSIRIINAPKKIGEWRLTSVTLQAVYPDGSAQTASCVQVGGVWVGTLAGSATAGSNENGYTVYASGVDENGLDVEGYVLGKGDVVVMEAGGSVPPDAISRLSAELDEKRYVWDMGLPAQPSETVPVWYGAAECEWVSADGLWRSEDGYVEIARRGSTEFYDVSAYSQLEPEKATRVLARVKLAAPSFMDSVTDGGEKVTVRSFDGEIATREWVSEQLSAQSGLSAYYTKSETSSAAELRAAFSDVYAKSETSSASEIGAALGGLATAEYVDQSVSSKADASTLTAFYQKSETSSASEIGDALENKADLSALHQDYIIDGAGKSISADGRTVVDRDEPSYWVLTFNYEQYQLSGAKGSASYYPSTPPYYDGQFKGELNWNVQEQKWTLLAYSWDPGITAWRGPDEYYDDASGYDASALAFDALNVGSCIWTTPTVSAVEILATREWTRGEERYASFPAWSAALQDRAVQRVRLEVSATTLVLPELAYPDRTQDFVVDVVNAYSVNGTSTSATFSLSGTIGTDYNVVVPEGESLADMTTLAAGELAEFYFTRTAFELSGIATWKVVKQVVEAWVPETV